MFNDFKESGFMYALAGAVVLFILAQAVFFLVRAWKRGKQLGVSTAVMKNTAASSALFSITPALSIVATVLALSAALGVVLPWIRLSVIGNITYETSAATTALEAMGAGGLSSEIMDVKTFITVMWVMTLGSIMPLILIPLFLKKIQKKMGGVVSKDAAWANAMSAAAFIGLICAFVGRAILGTGSDGLPDTGDGAGVLSCLTLAASVVFMLLLSLLGKKTGWKWMESFAMPLAMFGAMGVAILVTQTLPPDFVLFEWRT